MPKDDPLEDEKNAQEAILAASLVPIFAKFKQGARRAILDGDVLPGPLFSLDDTAKALETRYKSIQNSSKDAALNNFFLGGGDKLYGQLLEDWADQTSQRRGQIISRTSSTQAVQSRSEAMAALVAEGEGITNESLWALTGVILARKLSARLKLIAQTEVQAAYESTKFLKGQAILETPELSTRFETVDVWNSVLDGGERISHNIADGQERVSPIPFDVGGSQLLYPGDPSGPIKEIINCRCYLTSKVVEK